MAATGTALDSWYQDQTFHISRGNGKKSIESPLTTFHVAEAYEESASVDNLPTSRPQETQAADILPFKPPFKNSETAASVTSSQSATVAGSQSIIRAHFATTILSDLNNLQQYSGQANAASYANKLFRIIRQYRDLVPTEPYVEILQALYDAMAFENRWIEYSASQYADASKILRSYVEQKLDNSKVGKAILNLQAAGFDTLPFGRNDNEIYPNEEDEQQNQTEN